MPILVILHPDDLYIDTESGYARMYLVNLQDEGGTDHTFMYADWIVIN